MKKKTIAVDIDDVLAAEAEFIINYSSKKWGHTLSLEDWTEDWPKMWDLDFDETEKRAAELHLPGTVSQYRLLEDAHAALQKLAQRFKLVILSSRRESLREETEDWLLNNFAELFEETHYTGFWDTGKPGGHLATKGQLAREIGADYMIDDQPKHCFAAAEVGVEAILFGDFPTTRDLKLTPHVTRCKTWKEVLEYFNARS